MHDGNRLHLADLMRKAGKTPETLIILAMPEVVLDRLIAHYSPRPIHVR